MTGIKRRSGRKPHSFATAGTQQVLDAAAPKAAAILRDHILGKRKRLSPSRQRACEFIIDHAIGKARQKIEHSGGILTYGALAKEAEALEKKPRDILADALDIAKNYQEKPEEKEDT